MRYRIKTIGIFNPRTTNLLTCYNVQVRILFWWITISPYNETIHGAIAHLKKSKSKNSFEIEL